MASSNSSNGGDVSAINTISQLPDEILLHIFSYLPVENIVVCEKVNERWKTLARDPSIWRRIQIVYSGKPGTTEVTYCARQSQLEIISTHSEFICKLKLQYIYSYPILKSILSACRKGNLLSLELIMCRIAPDFQQELNVWHNLRKLSFKNSTIVYGEEIPVFAIPYNQFEDLRHLELSEFGLSYQNCGTLIGLKHLSHIYIDKIKELNRTFIVDLINSKVDVLQALHIYGGQQVDDDVLGMLTNCPHLQSLSIKFCDNLTDRGLTFLINLKNIQHLQIWNNIVFTEKCLLKVLGSPVMFDLHFLSLSKIQNITSPIIDIIYTHYRHLRHLALYQCPRIVETEEYELRLRQKFGEINVIYD